MSHEGPLEDLEALLELQACPRRKDRPIGSFACPVHEAASKRCASSLSVRVFGSETTGGSIFVQIGSCQLLSLAMGAARI